MTPGSFDERQASQKNHLDEIDPAQGEQGTSNIESHLSWGDCVPFV
jgi:hypothetical protein